MSGGHILRVGLRILGVRKDDVSVYTFDQGTRMLSFLLPPLLLVLLLLKGPAQHRAKPSQTKSPDHTHSIRRWS